MAARPKKSRRFRGLRGRGHAARSLPVLVGLVSLVAADAAGQLQVSGRLENSITLLYEPVALNLRVRNRSATPAVFGADGNVDVRVYVERRPGYPTRKTGKEIVIPETVVEPHERAGLQLDIGPAFEFSETGPYTVQATLKHGEDYYQTGRLLLEVVPGFEVGSLEVGLPGGGGERREYRLLSLSRDGTMSLFIRVDDRRNDLCYGVYELGRLLQNADPILEVDAAGRAHVLHRSGPAQFTHTIHEPSGRQVERTLYSSGAQVARLEPTEDGNLEVRGVQEDEEDRSGNRPAIRSFDPFE